MNEAKCQEFIEKATGGRPVVEGFSSRVIMEHVGLSAQLIFKVGEMTEKSVVYRCGNHTVVIHYKNQGDERFPEYTNFRAAYFPPRTTTIESPTY
jgi:hypothetical protein